MKKISALVLAMIMCLLCVGCSGGQEWTQQDFAFYNADGKENIVISDEVSILVMSLNQTDENPAYTFRKVKIGDDAKDALKLYAPNEKCTAIRVSGDDNSVDGLENAAAWSQALDELSETDRFECTWLFNENLEQISKAELEELNKEDSNTIAYMFSVSAKAGKISDVSMAKDTSSFFLS